MHLRTKAIVNKVSFWRKLKVKLIKCIVFMARGLLAGLTGPRSDSTLLISSLSVQLKKRRKKIIKSWFPSSCASFSHLNTFTSSRLFWKKVFFASPLDLSYFICSPFGRNRNEPRWMLLFLSSDRPVFITWNMRRLKNFSN